MRSVIGALLIGIGFLSLRTVFASETSTVLTLVANLDQIKVIEGQPIAGRIEIANGGNTPVVIDTLAGASVTLTRSDGRKPKLVRSMGMGMRDQPREEYFVVIEPGKKHTLCGFDSAAVGPNLSMILGGHLMAWDLSSGSYTMAVTYEMTSDLARMSGITNAWLGKVQSKAVTFEIVERISSSKTVKGLQLIAELSADKGRAILKNVSDKTILIDSAGIVEVQLVGANDKDVQGQAVPMSFINPTPESRFQKVLPGDKVEIAQIHSMAGAFMCMANPSTAFDLTNGTYRLRVTYTCVKDDSDVNGPAWTGVVVSSEEQIVIKDSRKTR